MQRPSLFSGCNWTRFYINGNVRARASTCAIAIRCSSFFFSFSFNFYSTFFLLHSSRVACNRQLCFHNFFFFFAHKRIWMYVCTYVQRACFKENANKKNAQSLHVHLLIGLTYIACWFSVYQAKDCIIKMERNGQFKFWIFVLVSLKLMKNLL